MRTATVLQFVAIAVLNASGQLALKMGSNAVASISGLITSPLTVLNYPVFILGGALYATSFVLYSNVLSRVPLSVAYPFMGLTYVFVVGLSVVVLEESFSWTQTAGILFIFLGISLIGVGME